jgi:hypothetical protein
MGIRKDPRRRLGGDGLIPLWEVLSALDDAVAAGQQPKRPVVHHFRISRSDAAPLLRGIRVASDMVPPPARPRELFDFKPASWELPDEPE